MLSLILKPLLKNSNQTLEDINLPPDTEISLSLIESGCIFVSLNKKTALIIKSTADRKAAALQSNQRTSAAVCQAIPVNYAPQSRKGRINARTSLYGCNSIPALFTYTDPGNGDRWAININATANLIERGKPRDDES